MKNYSKITVDLISDSFKDGLMQAQLRQTVTTSLPKQKTGNDLKGSLYSNEELGITSTDYQEVRVAWIPVAKNATVEQVQKDLETKAPKAVLFRVLASSPILDTDQQNVYKNGLTGDALESFNTKHGLTGAWSAEHSKILVGNIADRQAVRKGGEGDDKDELVMFGGKVQYRRVEFSDVPREDKDVRISIATTESIDLAPAISEVKEVAAV